MLEELEERERWERNAGDSQEGAQGEFEGGRSVHFVGTFMDALDAAHEIDPTIPRLLPITLRGYFGRLRSSTGATAGRKAPAATPEAPNPALNAPANPA